MRKLISWALTLTVIFASVPVFADWDNDEDILSLLSELEIMVGDGDGNYRLDDNVSRAEFAKIAVSASDSKNTVATGMNVSPFKDVTYKHWSAPYVRAAVTAGIVEGYVDATFKPDNTVSYEEALTMMLKVLGYTDEDFGYSWPYGQIGLAQNLNLTKNVDCSQGEAMTRRQVANLVYNALNTKKKDSQDKLISVFDCEVIEGVTVIATHNEDSSLGIDKVFTSSGTYEFDGEFNSDYIGRRGDIVVKNGDDFVSFTPRDQQVEEYTVTGVIGSDIILDGDMYSINSNTTAYYKTNTMTYESAAAEADTGDIVRIFKNSNGSVDYVMLLSGNSQINNETFEKYVIYSQLSDAVIGYRNGVLEQIDINDGTVCYKDNTKSTYSAVKSQMAMGDILYVKMDGNKVDYVSYEEGNMEGPIQVTNTEWISNFDTNASTSIMRNGNKVSAADIQTNDIIYYSSDLNMILAYTDKVTGVYEKASPTKDSPNSVTISGTEYTVESVNAFNALSSSGSFKYGDTVTVLLGRSGEIAGVVGGSQSLNTTSAGFVIETGKKDFTNPDNTVYSSYYAKVVTPDGNVNEYTTLSNYESLKCAVVRVSFKDGKASLSRQSSSGSISGKVDASDYKIGNTKLSEDVMILDTVGTYSDDIALYKRIYLQRLDGTNLSASKVAYYSKNALGEVDELILKDATGDMYTYGIITKRDQSTGSYTIDIDGNQSVYSTGFSTSVTGPYRLKMEGSVIENMTPLAVYGSKIDTLTRTEAIIGTNTYLLSDKVVVYEKKDSSTYMKIPIDDAINGDYKTMTAYYDKSQDTGGRIRIIIVQ